MAVAAVARRLKRPRWYDTQMATSGVPTRVGQSQRATGGKKVKLTTENAVTVAMYEASIPIM